MATWHAMDMAALNGETVTQGHADYCAEYGHATATHDGIPSVLCPRCGAVKPPEDMPADHGRTSALCGSMMYYAQRWQDLLEAGKLTAGNAEDIRKVERLCQEVDAFIVDLPRPVPPL